MLGKQYGTVRWLLADMLKRGEIVSPARGRYVANDANIANNESETEVAATNNGGAPQTIEGLVPTISAGSDSDVGLLALLVGTQQTETPSHNGVSIPRSLDGQNTADDPAGPATSARRQVLL